MQPATNITTSQDFIRVDTKKIALITEEKKEKIWLEYSTKKCKILIKDGKVCHKDIESSKEYQDVTRRMKQSSLNEHGEEDKDLTNKNKLFAFLAQFNQLNKKGAIYITKELADELELPTIDDAVALPIEIKKAAPPPETYQKHN
ncbi:MAG: hypothetical protein OEY79_03735 [Anaplasmataceae bacterium]|nr:hypothetical protein [Anaplasmataceae bacterium]